MIATGWDAYRRLDWTDIASRMRSPVIFDGRQVVSGKPPPRRDDAARNRSAHRKGQRVMATIEDQRRASAVTLCFQGSSDVIFTETRLKGAFIVDAERRADERGFFARIFCQKEFEELGLEPNVAQANMASSVKRGTLRGMHFQYPPATEAKLVRCMHGAVLDVIVDLRPESETYLQHVAVELSSREPASALRSRPLRSRLPDIARRHRHSLSGKRLLRAERRKRSSIR